MYRGHFLLLVEQKGKCTLFCVLVLLKLYFMKLLNSDNMTNIPIDFHSASEYILITQIFNQ